MPSVEAAAVVESLDWAYIDGDHTCEAVGADIDAYFARLRPGGVLCGDDYGAVGWWEDGVTRAVDSFATRARIELEVFGSQWFLRRPA